MNRSILKGCAALLALLAAPALAQEHPILKEARRIQDEVAQMRGLSFQAPVKVGVQKPDELKKMILQSFEEEASADEMEKQARVLKAFGLIPHDYDLRGAIIKFMSEQIGGFYDPEKKELFLIDRSGQMGGMEQQLNDRMVMAHELTHALQDQNWALDRWFEVLGEHEDRIQGYKCLVEGEAQLVGMSHLFGKMGRGKVDMKQLNRMQEMMLKMSPEGAKFRSVPPYLIENMMFPYTQGAEFIQELQRKKGWEGISAAFADPPASTEQVLHPEKYYVQRDEPREISLSSAIRKVLGGEKKTTELYENTLGEFNVSLILRGLGLQRPAAERAASGWDGDRFVGYQTQDGRAVVVWLSVWDSEADAQKFEQAYRAGLERAKSSAHLERRGDLVLWISGANGEELPQLVTKGFRALMVEQRYAPSPELLAKPVPSDFIPGADKPAAGETKPEATTEPQQKSGLVRLESEGASFVAPEGMEQKPEPIAGLKDLTRAFFEGKTQQLRVIELPMPIDKAPEEVKRELGNRGETVEKVSEARFADGPAFTIVSTEGSDKAQVRTHLFMTANGAGRTLLLALSQRASDPNEALEQTMQGITDTLWLDCFGNDQRKLGVQKVIHEGHTVDVARVLPKQTPGDPTYGRIHRQDDEQGASVAVSVRATSSNLAAIARRTVRMLSLSQTSKVKVLLAGVVKRGEQEVFELEYEAGDRRVRQRILLVDGARWTMTCSAPAARFDAYRATFGDALRAFAVEKAKEKKVYQLR
ncbi:MAG: hypothetical protein AB7N76_36555 [Planctomycetota bacterium]